ncbi:RNA chaperone Hfq [Vibrio owensii]|uniref:RNA chaperone Hfq n=1 Tax=Vibrio owensii TaxID=696485 RepID=UPI0033965BCC
MDNYKRNNRNNKNGKNFGSRERKQHGIKGHDARLLELLKKGAQVTFNFVNGEQITGVIKQYDAFTISIDDGEPAPYTVFKSSMVGFREVTA